MWSYDGRVNQRQTIGFEDRTLATTSPAKTGSYGIGWFPEFLYPSKMVYENMLNQQKTIHEKWIQTKQDQHMFMIKTVRAKQAKMGIVNNPSHLQIAYGIGNPKDLQIQQQKANTISFQKHVGATGEIKEKGDIQSGTMSGSQKTSHTQKTVPGSKRTVSKIKGPL